MAFWEERNTMLDGVPCLFWGRYLPGSFCLAPIGFSVPLLLCTYGPLVAKPARGGFISEPRARGEWLAEGIGVLLIGFG